VPKQSQAYVITGVAVLILLAVMFSNKPAEHTAHPATAQPLYTSGANQREIEQLQWDLTEEQRKVEQQSAATPGSPAGEPSTSHQAAPAKPATSGARRDQLEDTERALLFKARFATNLVSTGSAVRQASPQIQTSDSFPSPAAAASSWSSGPTSAAEGARSGPPARRPPEISVNSAVGPAYVLFQGSTIDTVLLNRLDGEFSGPVKVMVTNPVYCLDRQHILIPDGTFVLGDVQRVSGFGQKRLAMAFHRMLMPDGYSVDLDQFHGLNQAGETGLKDKVNNHYLQIFGASIALGVIAGATESTTNGGLEANGSDLWRQGVAANLSQSGTTVLDRFINLSPTLTIPEGHRIKIYLTQDLLLPAYQNHTIPPNI
jgi:type IV secretion system protein VirB10